MPNLRHAPPVLSYRLPPAAVASRDEQTCPARRPKPGRDGAAALLLVLALALVGCADATPAADGCPSECPCTEAGCPAGVCGAQVTLGPTCAEAVPWAEAFVGGCLEEDELRPGIPLVACGFVPAGADGEVVVRGESMQWGPFPLRCPAEGGLLITVTLDCPTP